MKKTIDMDEAVKLKGFESFQEFNRLVFEVDLTSQEKRDKFDNWQYYDGTKKGLLKLDKGHGFGRIS